MRSQANDIAIIGIGCRFPDADNGERFFRNLLDNKDSVTEIPAERWSYEDLYAAPPGEHRLTAKWGGFLSDISSFDARFFKILPSEAELLDPQQKLFLTCSWEALEDAGYARRAATAGRQVGVYAGVTWNEFSLYANEYGYLHNAYKGPGSLYWGIPNRVSYFFDFAGPSIAVDTACSSSLVAIHLAAQGLRSGECEMALAGAVNLNLHPAKYLFLSGSNFLSSEGKCRGFGEGGDGYVPSEGVAVIVLKTLEAAEQAGDRIYGIIKATATNHGGNATGYTVPNPRAQAGVIHTALQQAGINPRDIGYVECHGTGTELGDPIEVAGLRMAFEKATDAKGFCGIGTVKSNIGHTEATAGLAGLIKVLYSMRHAELPATLHAEQPNRKIDFANSPFYLVKQNQPWSDQNGTRLAGISSFGAGGSNGHCIVQSYLGDKPASKPVEAATYAIPISSANKERTLAYCARLKAYLEEHNASVDLADIAFSLRRRESFAHRRVFLVDSVPALIDLLAETIKAGEGESIKAVDGALIDPCYLELQDWAQKWVGAAASLADMPIAGEGALISIPTYAFERNRSWLHASRYLYRKPLDASLRLHPLVDSNSSTIAGGEFNKRLHRNEYFVEEHLILDEPVLPGVCLVEMALSCGRIYLDATAVSLADVWFVEPVKLGGQQALDLQVKIENREPRFEVLTTRDGLKHVSGKLRLDDARVCPPAVDLSSRLGGCSEHLNRDAIYRRFAQSGIRQLGRFKVLAELHYQEHQAIGRLELADNVTDQERYYLHPTLMDGAVQTAMLHLFQRLPQTATVLPFQIGACIRYRPLTAVVYAIATLKGLESKKYDVLLCDAEGTPLAELKDFVLREYRAKQRECRPLLFSSILREQISDVSSPAEPPRVDIYAMTPLHKLALKVKSIPTGWSLNVWDDETARGLLAGNRDVSTAPGAGRIVALFNRTNTESSLTGLYAEVSQTGRRLFDFVKALVEVNQPADVMICLVDDSPQGEAFARACLGMLKCLNLELPKLRFRLLEMADAASEQELLQRIAAEFETASAPVHVCYKACKRLVAARQETAFTPVAGARPGAWLITGAAGGLGLHVTRHLLARGEQVVMLGRSPLSATVSQTLADYPEANWKYLQADLTQAQQVGGAVTAAMDLYRGPWGLVHCAGVLRDAAFFNKEWDDFEQVIAAKLGSLMLLCDRLADQDVSRMVLFSSLTAVQGNQGQTDYAFANGFMDGVAAVVSKYLASRPQVTAINWPYWADGGMQIDANRLPAYIEANASEPLPTETGLMLFDRLIESAGISLALVYGDATIERLADRQVLKAAPAIETDVTESEADVTQPAVAAEQTQPLNKRQDIQTYLMRFLERELKMELTEEDLEVEFIDLGVDSIAQMDLITKLEKEQRFKEIPQSLLVDNKNISTLVEFFYVNHSSADYRLR